MAIRVKSGGGQRWVERASVARESYITGAQNPRNSWSKATADGEANWKAGVNDAASKGKFSKGVLKAGDSAWLKGVTEKGADRYSSGVALAQTKYETNIKPYLDEMSRISLTKRGPKNSQVNYDRVKQVGQALSALKAKLKG